MSVVRSVTLGAAAIVAVALPLFAQNVPDSVRARNGRVTDSLVSLLRTQYVDADTGSRIAAHLAAKAQAGAFADAPTREELAKRLTLEMRAINGDRHLAVRVPPPGTAAQPIGGTLGGAGAISDVRVLDGNIAYVAFKQIPVPSPEVQAKLASTMATLATADAVIIDVRDDGGGAGNFNDIVWGYLAGGADSVATMRAQPRNGPAFQRWTKPVTGARPAASVPIYVLANGHTGSAAEGLAFFLQQSGRATVIGERTAGAGHNVAGFPLPDDMQALISITRVFYPPTMKEWERTGVVPNDSVPSATALCAAHRAALNTLAARAGSGRAKYDAVAPMPECR